MPNIKSAKKRVDVNEKNRAINKAYKSELATGLKKYNAAVAAGDVNLAKSLLPVTVSLIDESVTRGIIHKNKADRKKADVNTKLFKLEASSKPAKKVAKKEEVKVEEVKVEAEAPKAKKTTSRAKKTETAEAGEKKTAAKKTATKKETTTAKTTRTKKTAKTETVAE